MAYGPAFDPPELPADASTLRHQLEDAVLVQGRQGPDTTPTARLVLSYLFTTDKAAREYMSGCSRMRDHMQHGSMQARVEALGAFENCINATKRSLRLLERLAQDPRGPGIDRTVRKLAQNSRKTLTHVRDRIEHIDADIVADEGLQPGEAHMLTITKTGKALEIGANKISFATLRSTIKGLHSVGIGIVAELPKQPHAA